MGANLGYFTMLGSSLVGGQGKVIAFEPNPQNLQLIYSTMLQNRVTNAIVYPYAASDNSSILRFTTVGSNGGVVTNYSKEQKHFLLVQSVILDDLLKDESRIDLVKMDIEAHEPAAIRGMTALIRRHKPKLITEFHPWAMRINNAAQPIEYLNQLYGLGYQLSIIETSGRLITVSSADEIMGYWEELHQETIHLDLLAQ